MKALTLEDQAELLREAIDNHLRYTLAKYQVLATPRNYHAALVLALRNLLAASTFTFLFDLRLSLQALAGEVEQLFRRKCG